MLTTLGRMTARVFALPARRATQVDPLVALGAE